VSSGASAADTAAFTAAVTSIPGVDAPVAACRISLKSIADAGSEADRSELNPESELLIGFAVSFRRSGWLALASG
jgi:hypothetical protein